MKNYKIIISYDGTKYHGWERKTDMETIQGKLETVLERLCGVPVNVIGAGRTDAGVHARAMTANVHMNVQMAPAQIQNYMNRYLPDDIAVLEIREASEQFHARYHAAGKTYRYTCYEGDAKPVFDRKYVHVLEHAGPLDIEAMRRACSYLEGTHDYKSFCGNPKMKKSTVRTVDRIEIVKRKGYIFFTFHGTGFLQNMVRILVGTLLEVGMGKRKPDDMPKLLEERERSKAGPMAPARGLCLMEVEY